MTVVKIKIIMNSVEIVHVEKIPLTAYLPARAFKRRNPAAWGLCV